MEPDSRTLWTRARGEGIRPANLLAGSWNSALIQEDCPGCAGRTGFISNLARADQGFYNRNVKSAELKSEILAKTGSDLPDMN